MVILQFPQYFVQQYSASLLSSQGLGGEVDDLCLRVGLKTPLEVPLSEKALSSKMRTCTLGAYSPLEFFVF